MCDEVLNLTPFATSTLTLSPAWKDTNTCHRFWLPKEGIITRIKLMRVHELKRVLLIVDSTCRLMM